MAKKENSQKWEIILNMPRKNWKHLSLVVPFPLCLYAGCPRRKGQNFGRVFLMLKYTDITQNTYIQSWTVTEIMAREKCGLLAGLRTVPCQLTGFRMSVLDGRVRLQKYRWRWTVNCLPVDNAVPGAAALWIVSMSCIVLGTLKDNYDMSAGFFSSI